MRPTQHDRIIEHLKIEKSITSVWAMKHYIFRLSERIRELEEAGWKFVKGYVELNGKKTHTYRYVVKSMPKKRRV